MKRVLSCVLCLLLSLTCAAEAPAPEPQAVAERAIPLMELLAACDSFYSFDDTPSAELAGEAVRAYLASHPDAPDLTLDELLRALFTCEWETLPDVPDAHTLRPARVTLEDVYPGATGTVIACVKAELDYGDGFEFAWYAEFTLAPDDNAEYGARISRALIPD